VTAARRPVTVRERIARLVRPSQINRAFAWRDAEIERLRRSRDLWTHRHLEVTGALIDTSAALSETEGKRAVAERRADQLERDKAQAQRERNAALGRAAIAERRLAAHCAEWAPRAADAGLLNAPTHPGAALTDTTHAQPSGDIPS